MPLTLEKLFSQTVESSFEALGETVNLVWSPARYTGEMDDLAAKIGEEDAENRAELLAMREAGDVDGAANVRAKIDRATAAMARTFVARLLVSWDLLDGVTPVPIEVDSLKRLPDFFVIATFLAMSAENQADPPNAPSSDATSSPKASSGRSRRGTPSSGARKASGSRRGK